MSIVTLLTKSSPTMFNGGISFDAVLQTQTRFKIDILTTPVETGAQVYDHRIWQPIRLNMLIAVAGNKLSPQLTDFIGGGLSNLTKNSAVFSTLAGLSAGWLSGEDATAPSAALLFLVQQMQTGDPTTVSDGRTNYSNMVIESMDMSRDPENETGLIISVDFVEIMVRSRLAGKGQPQQSQLSADDVSSTSISSVVNKGRVIAKDVSSSVQSLFDMTGLIDL